MRKTFIPFVTAVFMITGCSTGRNGEETQGSATATFEAILLPNLSEVRLKTVVLASIQEIKKQDDAYVLIYNDGHVIYLSSENPINGMEVENVRQFFDDLKTAVDGLKEEANDVAVIPLNDPSLMDIMKRYGDLLDSDVLENFQEGIGSYIDHSRTDGMIVDMAMDMMETTQGRIQDFVFAGVDHNSETWTNFDGTTSTRTSRMDGDTHVITTTTRAEGGKKTRRVTRKHTHDENGNQDSDDDVEIDTDGDGDTDVSSSDDIWTESEAGMPFNIMDNIFVDQYDILGQITARYVNGLIDQTIFQSEITNTLVQQAAALLNEGRYEFSNFKVTFLSF